MTKLMLTKKTEISVTEEKKGKQIAVKENNITSLKQFFQTHYTAPVAPTMPTPTPVAPTPQITPEVINPQQPINNIEAAPILQPAAPVIENVIPQAPTVNELATPISPTIVPDAQNVATPIIQNPVEPTPIINTPVANEPIMPIPTPTVVPNLETESTEDSSANQAINLVPETMISEQLEDEMDPELKEIKNRLDQVINDLNNYKKKIKILETEVNQNLEKSREVLKDTQAAAKIMAIQQERQKQITEEINGTAPLNDPTRVLQKDVA